MSTPDEVAARAADDVALAAAEACANKWRARGDEPVIGEAVHAEHTLEAVAIARRRGAIDEMIRDAANDSIRLGGLMTPAEKHAIREWCKVIVAIADAEKGTL